MRIFWKKLLKSPQCRGGSAPEPPFVSGGGGSAPRSRDFTPAYYYNFVEYVFSIKCVSLLFKKEQNNPSKSSGFVSSALSTYFSLQTLQFLLTGGERKNISCLRAQGTLATPLRPIYEFLPVFYRYFGGFVYSTV